MSDAPRTVLIVDDEKSVLNSLRRLLRKEGWQLLLTTSPKEGLKMLDENRVDLVVSDIRMHEMDGVSFLKKAKKKHPGTIRIILTGFAVRKSVTEAFTEADIYQLISKPWDDEELKEVLRGALEQSARAEEQSKGLQRLLNDIDSLPSLPKTYLDLREALNTSDEGNLNDVADVISRDPAIAARTLRIANSAFFGQRRQVDTIQRAISIIGLVMIENIVLAASVFRDLESDEVPGFDHSDFWRHSLGCGLISKFVEEQLSRDRKRMEMAMLAGTLHDLGKLVFAKYYHREYVEVVDVAKRDLEFISVKETALLGVSHAVLGGYLADWWNMPPPIVDAIKWHNNPSGAEEDRAMCCAVHLADIIVHRAKIGESGNGRIPEAHPSLHISLGVSQARLQEIVGDVMERVEGEDFLAF